MRHSLEAARPSRSLEKFVLGSLSAITTTARQAADRWRVLGTACLAHLIHDGYADMLYLLFPFWQRELGLSLTEVGLLKALYSGAMAVCQVPAGRLSERFGEKTPLVVGTVLTACAVLALHWATTPFLLGSLLVLGGLGASVQHPLASTIVSKAYKQATLRTVLGAYNFAGDLGKVLIPGLLALLIVRFGWPTGVEIVGAIGLAVAAVLFVTLAAMDDHAAPVQPDSPAHRRVLPESVRRRCFLALSAIGMLDSATRTGFLTFLPFVLAGKGAGTGEVGAALSLIFAGGAAGKFACGALATRVGVLRTVILTETGTALLIALVLGSPRIFCLALMPLLGIALNGTSSVLYGTVPELTPAGREARSFGLFYTITIGAGALAPTMYGVVGDRLGLTASMLLVAGVVLVVVPLTALLRPAFASHASLLKTLD